MDMNARCSDYIKTLPSMSQGVVRRALVGDASPRQAIKAKCLTCCNCDRIEVAACVVTTCPLHAYRPQWGRDTGEEMPIPAPRHAEGSGFGAERAPAIPDPHPAEVFLNTARF